MVSCRLRLNTTTISITPEMAAELVRRKLIKPTPKELGKFTALVKDDLIIWKVLRQR